MILFFYMCNTWNWNNNNNINNNNPWGDAKHLIGKGGRTLQCLQVLSGTLIGVVDQSNGNSLIQIYGRCEGRNIVRHFLSCLQEGFYGVLGVLERALGDSG